MVPAGFEWTLTLAAGREHYLFGGHDSLYARCSGSSRQSLWLGQIGPPPVCESSSNVNAGTVDPSDATINMLSKQPLPSTIFPLVCVCQIPFVAGGPFADAPFAQQTLATFRAGGTSARAVVDDFSLCILRSPSRFTEYAAHNHAKAHEFVPVEGFRLKKPWALSVKPTCSTCNLRL